MSKHPIGVWRQEISVEDLDTVNEIMIPEGVDELTIFAIGGGAGELDVEMSPSTGIAIMTGAPVPVWIAIDASLTGVGATMIVFKMTAIPVAIRAVQVAPTDTGILILVGVRRH